MGFGDKTNWIWSPSWGKTDEETPGLLYFRKEFDLAEIPEEGILNISADTRYKLYVNGNLAGVGPCKGDRQVWYFDTVDIAPYLKKGKNVIAVSVLRYPVNPAMGNHSLFRTFTPGLYVEGWLSEEKNDNRIFAKEDRNLNKTAENCNKKVINADETWKCKKNTNVQFLHEEEGFSPLMVHEKAAGDAAFAGWKTTEYDDSAWENVRSYVIFEMPPAVSPGNLFPRPIPSMYRKKRTFHNVIDVKKSSFTAEEWTDFLHEKRSLVIPANPEELVEIDTKEEMTGYIYADFQGGKSSKIQFLYAESYLQNGYVGPAHVPAKEDREDKVKGHLDGFKDVYQVAGYGSENQPETFETYWFRTFRFVQIHIQTGEEPLVLKHLDYEETGYPLEVKTQVNVSDEYMKDIWEISERTLRRCMQETYTDCPYYEQLQYIMDSRTQILYTYAVSADDRLARQCMDDMSRSQRADGLLNCCYPNCNPNVIPGFSIYYILMVYDHMMYFGDKKLVRSHMPYIENVLNYFHENLTEEGYVGQVGTVIGNRFWSFIDWAAEWNPTSGMPPAGLKGPITMESLLYIYGLQHAAKLLEFIGRKEDAANYMHQAEAVQNAVRRYCTGANGMIQDGPGVEEYSQHCQVFAVLTDTVDAEVGHKNLLKTIQGSCSVNAEVPAQTTLASGTALAETEAENHYAQCTVAMRFYLFRALEKTGLYEYSEHYWDTWRNMLKLHCTTSIESDTYARSECHAWGALALYELPTIILGVRPAEPGYKSIKISPVPGYMTHAEGTVITPVGEVQVSWKKEQEKLKINYKVPEGVNVILS